MAENISQLLLATMDGDAKVRVPAEQQLRNLEENQFPQYLGALVEEIASPGRPVDSKRAAAIQIKRCLTGQDDTSRNRKLELWQNALSEANRELTKNTLLASLESSSVIVSKQVAQSIEAVARLELSSERGWPELPYQLAECFVKAQAQQGPEGVIGPLLALGYFANLAATMGFDIQQDHVNLLLDKISVCMNTDMSEEVQVAATKSLEDTLEFANFNMEREADREQIMKLILNMTTSRFASARTAAFQCLTQVATIYYIYLRNSIQHIWNVTKVVIQNVEDDEGTAKSALNFWAELALEEADRLTILQDSDGPVEPDDECLRIIDHFSAEIVQMLFSCLLKEDEEPDDEEENRDSIYGFAEYCMMNVAGCLEEKIIQYAFAFAAENIGRPDWRNRQAAVFVLGATFSSVKSESIKDNINSIVEMLFFRLAISPPGQGPLPDYKQAPEPVANVRGTACWVISIVCNLHFYILNQKNMQETVTNLLTSLRDKPRVAHMSATALHNFAKLFENSSSQPSNDLSPLFQGLITSLWEAGCRLDSEKWGLMTNAYEALMAVIFSGAMDMKPLIGQILGHSVIRLQEISVGNVPDPSGGQEGKLCEVIFTCLLKLGEFLTKIRMPNAPDTVDMFNMPDTVVQSMLTVLKKPSSTAHADAFQVLGEVALIMGPNFKRYAQHVMPLAYQGLSAPSSAAQCIACIRMCEDICSSLQADFVPFLETLMPLIDRNLQSDELQRDVKPPHLHILSAIFECIERKEFRQYFDKYFTKSVEYCLTACFIPGDITDEDFGDYLNFLRSNALEALEMIINSASPSDVQPFLSQVYNVAAMVASEIQDPRNFYMHKDPAIRPHDLASLRLSYSVSDAVIKAVLGILGDLAQKLGEAFTAHIREKRSVLEPLFVAGMHSEDESVVETTKFASGWLRL